ncbi:hypothetical protein GCM10025751_25840 [Haladaptatus pallidirubidus]|uniref:Uncharacterized protein n=1 Tax=Haladaptatus pallidirubidus TaxID=1008152 RepID=A0AAV3UI09_9EURY
MHTIRQLSHHVNTRVKSLSRRAYAIVIGISTGFAVFVFSLLMGYKVIFQPILISVTMTVVYYAIGSQANHDRK